MELREPRSKNQHKIKISSFLPIIKISENKIFKFSGYFNGLTIIVKEQDEIKKLNSMGCFGKGNLSRGYPTFDTSEQDAKVIRRRVFNQRKKCTNESSNKKKNIKVIVVPDSEDENEDYFTNLKPEYQIDPSCLKEVLNLSLEEAFFLAYYVQCLDIYNHDELLSKQKAWELFRETDQYFIQNYSVYHHFRSKNWIVKSGIKFGGDFLLYKEGPPFYHASYLVIIDVLDKTTLQRRDDMCRRSMEIRNLLGLNRLCETVGKELLICQLLWPEDLSTIEALDLAKFSINETIMRRWIPSQNRELLEL